jgi:hypothetical protein
LADIVKIVRRAPAHLWLLATLAFGCSSNGTSTADGGATPSVDAGECGEACLAPDGGECLEPKASCSAGGELCCPGFVCLDGGCAQRPNPCSNGEQLLPSGCGCDPTLGADAGCAAGFVCDSDLQCVADAGAPVILIAQPVGAPCDPFVSYPDGGAAPPCAQADPEPDGGTDAGTAIDCVPDPSGVYLYVCAQACGTNADCPLAWQTCGSAFAASGYCGDNPCTPFPAPSTKAFFAACPDGGGLCLPFSALVSTGTSVGVESYGVCLQASPDAGPNAACAAPPSRDGALCDSQQLCVLDRCRNPCNAAPDAGLPDAGLCLASEVCWPLGVQAVVPGAYWAAGGCVEACELDGGNCDAGARGADAGSDAGIDAGLDGGPDAGLDGGAPDGGNDGGQASDGGDGG